MQVEIFFILDWITYSIIVQVLLEINISINIFLYWQAIKTSLIMTDTYISLLVSQSVGLFYLFILKDWRFAQQEQVVLTLFLQWGASNYLLFWTSQPTKTVFFLLV